MTRREKSERGRGKRDNRRILSYMLEGGFVALIERGREKKRRAQE